MTTSLSLDLIVNSSTSIRASKEEDGKDETPNTRRSLTITKKMGRRPLTLSSPKLTVYVWDPLLEWTRGDFHDDAALGGEERKGMELAVSLSLFASRVQEIRIPLQEHHDLWLEAIPSVESALKRFLDALNQYEVVSSVFYHVDQERSALLIHETSAKSLVAEANSSSEKVHALYEMQVHEFGQAKALGIEKSQEATTWIEQHGRVIDALRSGSLPEIETCINLSDAHNALTLIRCFNCWGPTYYCS